MKKLSYLVVLLVAFLFCSCEPGPNVQEEKVYKVTLTDEEDVKEIYYKGINWYSDPSCANKITSVEYRQNITYEFEYDLTEDGTTTVEGCTPSSITEDKYTKAVKRFMGYYYNNIQIVDENGVLKTLSNPSDSIEATAKIETGAVTLPTDIKSAMKEFKGWYTTSERTGDVAPSSFVPEENTKFYAKWEDTGVRNVYFEFAGNNVNILVDDKEVSTTESYKISREDDLYFKIKDDGTFKSVKVEYKYVGENDDNYKVLESKWGNYIITSGKNNIVLRFTIQTPITFSYIDNIKYLTVEGKEISIRNEETRQPIPVNANLEESFSFKIENKLDPSSHNLKITLNYGSIKKELLPNENGVFTINNNIITEGMKTGIIVDVLFIMYDNLSVYNSEQKDVLKIRRIVDEQSVIMPSEYFTSSNSLSIKINSGEKFDFKIELNEPTQYDITKVELFGRQNEVLTPNADGVYSISGEHPRSMIVTLKAHWYPIIVDGDVDVLSVQTNEKLDRFTTGILSHITITPRDKTKVVATVEMEYKVNDNGNQYRTSQELLGLKNEEGVKIYTISSKKIIDDVKFTVSLEDKNISLITSGDSVKWTQENDAVLPDKIERYSNFSFRVVSTINGQVIGTVSVVSDDISTILQPNEDGVYTLTSDITGADSITLSATTKTPTNKTTVIFKGEGVAFKENGTDTVITEKSITENSEFKFKVELEDSSCEIDRVKAMYNGILIDLKEKNGIYILSPYITAFNAIVIAEVKYKSVALTLNSASDYIISGSNGEPFKETLPYKTEYKFKIAPKDSSKKITKVEVLRGDILFPVFYLYADKDGIYTLTGEDVTDDITFEIYTVDVNGEDIITIENGKTVSVETQDGKIPYVLITNFTPSKTYASEPLRSSDTRSNNIYNYSLTPNNVSQTSLYSSVMPRVISTVSSPRMENGKVVWNNYSFNNGKFKVNYKELFTDTNNKIIYLIDGDKYSVSEDSRAREVIDYLYSGPDALARMAPDLLITLQRNVAPPSDNFPNKAYLFDKSETDKGYFFVMIDRFEDRGESISTLGYFRRDIYLGDAENMPYASFFLNSNYGFDDEKGKDLRSDVLGFISSFAHEYTHYLESDYKNVNNYEDIASIHFLSEGYANYVSSRGTKDASAVDIDSIAQMLVYLKIYEPKNRENVSYSLGHLFFLYIEEKYGEDMPRKIMTDDKSVFKAVEYQTGKTFGEVYNDFILNLVFSGYTGTVNVNGTKYGDKDFAKYKLTNYDGRYINNHAFEYVYSDEAAYTKNHPKRAKDMNTKEDIYDDIKMILDANEGLTSVLGEMSFRLVCFPNGEPSTLTLTSDSPFIKAYLFYSDKIPQ